MPIWSFEVVSKGQERAELGESPCWDPVQNVLWWVDVSGRQLLRTDVDTGRSDSWGTPEVPGFVVLLASETPAVGMESGIYGFVPESGVFELLVAVEQPGCRFNDATVDAHGRLWASTMALDASPGRASIHLVDGHGRLTTVVSGLAIPNGLAVDLGRGRLFYSDSHPDVQSIWERPLLTDGVGAERLFATTAALRGRPDGAALDRDGRYWIAGVDGGELYVFGTDGQLAATISVPFPAPTKPCFFGHDGRALAVTSKAVGDNGGRLALAEVPGGAPAGMVQPCWAPTSLPGAAIRTDLA